MLDITSDLTPSVAKPVLMVCVTCRRGLSRSELGEAPFPGRQMHDALLAGLDGDAVTIQPVECMSSCGRGCTAAVSMPGKWTLLLGGLGPENAGDLAEWVGLYAASKSGMVPASKRPAALAEMVIARLPAAPADTRAPS